MPRDEDFFEDLREQADRFSRCGCWLRSHTLFVVQIWIESEQLLDPCQCQLASAGLGSPFWNETYLYVMLCWMSHPLWYSGSCIVMIDTAHCFDDAWINCVISVNICQLNLNENNHTGVAHYLREMMFFFFIHPDPRWKHCTELIHWVSSLNGESWMNWTLNWPPPVTTGIGHFDTLYKVWCLLPPAVWVM